MIDFYVIRGVLPPDGPWVDWPIFAETQDDAHHIFAQFFDEPDYLPEGWRGNDWSLYRAHGRQEQLDKMRAIGKEGLGIYDEVKGWQIVPPPLPVSWAM